MLAVFFLGLVTAVGSAMSGIDRSRVTRPARLPQGDWVCWMDRWGEMCRTKSAGRIDVARNSD